jgi:hypothetical protein
MLTTEARAFLRAWLMAIVQNRICYSMLSAAGVGNHLIWFNLVAVQGYLFTLCNHPLLFRFRISFP